MSDNEVIKKKDINFKFAVITPIIIIAIIAVFFAFLIINSYLNKRINLADVKLFEKAYVKITEYEKAKFEDKELQYEEIIKILDILLAKYPNSKPAERAVFYKGYVYFHIEKYDEAREWFDKFVKKYKKSHLLEKAYYFLSYTYSEKKDFDKAVETLKIFENEKKDSYFAPMALLHMGFCYEQKKDKDNAIKTYQKIVDQYAKTSQVDMAKKKILLLKYDIKLTDKDTSDIFKK